MTLPDERLDAELFVTGALSQHLLVDSSKARRLLGWEDTDPSVAIRTPVAWHLAHPPA